MRANRATRSPSVLLALMDAPTASRLEEFQTLERHAGLDEYEVRTWRGWHHNVTLALLAGARSCWISSGGVGQKPRQCGRGKLFGWLGETQRRN